MLSPLTDSPQKLKLEKVQENSSLLCKPEFPSATNTFCFIKNTKKNTLQQVTGGNTANIVLKKMARYFLKTSPLNKILEFQNQKIDYEICTKRKF